MSQGRARGIHCRWKSWTNGPVMCPLWGLCWGLSPVRQSKDELSVYSHPLPAWSSGDSLLSSLAEFPFWWDTDSLGRSVKDTGTRNRWREGQKHKKSAKGEAVECYHSLYNITFNIHQQNNSSATLWLDSTWRVEPLAPSQKLHVVTC